MVLTLTVEGRKDEVSNTIAGRSFKQGCEVAESVVFQGPVFLIFDVSQQWLDRIFLSEGGPPIIFDSLSTLKFCDYLDSGWVKSFHPREDHPVFCNFYLL